MAEQRKSCILVADDSTTIRTLVCTLLTDRGYTVLPAADGVQALRLYVDHRDEIDGVILDEEMPGLGGHETLRALLAINPGVRAVLVSGGADATALGGFQALVLKPFKLPALLAAVERLVAR
jgi:CheY-like chemotaxis protein